MRSICCGLGVTLVALVLLGTSGCGEDNDKAAQITSAPPPPGAAPPPKTQEEYYKQKTGTTDTLKSQGYPGAK